MCTFLQGYHSPSLPTKQIHPIFIPKFYKISQAFIFLWSFTFKPGRYFFNNFSKPKIFEFHYYTRVKSLLEFIKHWRNINGFQFMNNFVVVVLFLRVISQEKFWFPFIFALSTILKCLFSRSVAANGFASESPDRRIIRILDSKESSGLHSNMIISQAVKLLNKLTNSFVSELMRISFRHLN